jgi:hypothetical protein
LAAELALIFADERIEIQYGLYGDFVGNLRRLASNGADCGIVLMEWTDLDPRLGIRNMAALLPSVYSDILSTVGAHSLEVQQAIEKACQRMPVVLSMPTLPLPPISFVPGWQASSFEIDLKAAVHSVASQVSLYAQVRVLSDSTSRLSQNAGQVISIPSILI